MHIQFMNIIKGLRSRSFFSVVLSVALSVAFVAVVVNAATTISTNITTEGTMGVSSTSPWGLLSVESTSSADASTPIFVVGDQGTSTPFIYVSGNDGSVGIGSTTPSATPLGVVGDAYISSGLGVGTVVTSDGRIIASVDMAVASTSPWGQLSVEAAGLSGGAPIFVVGDQGTSTPMLLVDGNAGAVGMSTTSSQEVLNVGGDAFFGSSATTTIVMDSTGTDSEGACLQMRGAEGILYRAYIVATTSSQGVAASWQIEAGLCQ
jgi:hypothetical protein